MEIHTIEVSSYFTVVYMIDDELRTIRFYTHTYVLKRKTIDLKMEMLWIITAGSINNNIF